MTGYTDVMTAEPDAPEVRTYTLKRDGQRNLVLDGVLLGEASSRRGDQERWFEVRIFRTEAGRFVVAGAGRSIVDGETDRCWAEICDDGADVIAALIRVDDDDVEYLTRTARDALNDAAERDETIRDAFYRRVA